MKHISKLIYYYCLSKWLISLKKKIVLLELATELGESIPSNSKITNFKTIIIKSSDYDKPFIKELLIAIIEEGITMGKNNRT